MSLEQLIGSLPVTEDSLSSFEIMAGMHRPVSGIGCKPVKSTICRIVCDWVNLTNGLDSCVHACLEGLAFHAQPSCGTSVLEICERALSLPDTFTLPWHASVP